MRRRKLKLNQENLFKCGAGASQVAITPGGELKLCLMIDYPRCKILDQGLEKAWGKTRELVRAIRPDKNYRCSQCSLNIYCKWCPAKAWLKKGNFTSCDEECRRQADFLLRFAEKRGVTR